MNDEGLADVEAANPFRLPRLYPGMPRRAGFKRRLQACSLTAFALLASPKSALAHPLRGPSLPVANRLKLKDDKINRSIVLTHVHSGRREGADVAWAEVVLGEGSFSMPVAMK